jgi:hypothetical protein
VARKASRRKGKKQVGQLFIKAESRRTSENLAKQ